VNPAIKTIPEIYPGIEEEAVRVGADVYSLYPVNDAIAHEYEFGAGDHMASSRTPLDWFSYQVGMHTFRAFAQGKATWILNYSWDGDQKVDRREAMMNLAMSEVMAGGDLSDAPVHPLAGSNDLPTRKKIFSWIKAHEKTFYSPRTAITPIGVYFSPQRRNVFAKEFIASYRGILILVMQKHLEFQIVTPRTLTEFQADTLILPDVRLLSDSEKAWLAKFAESKKVLVITGEDDSGLGDKANIFRFNKCPGKDYSAVLQKDFDATAPHREHEFLESLKPATAVRVTASPQIATSIARVNGKPHVFFANFSGLSAGVNPIQTPQTNIQIRIAGSTQGRGFFLPFLGEAQPLDGIGGDGGLTFTL